MGTNDSVPYYIAVKADLLRIGAGCSDACTNLHTHTYAFHLRESNMIIQNTFYYVPKIFDKAP